MFYGRRYRQLSANSSSPMRCTLHQRVQILLPALF